MASSSLSGSMLQIFSTDTGWASLAPSALLLSRGESFDSRPFFTGGSDTVSQYCCCLVWLTYSRPDICYAVSTLSSFSTKRRQCHRRCSLRTMRYVSGTVDLGIFYRRAGGFTLRGWCDSDWAGNPDSRRSTTGVVFTLGSGPISWSSKRQPTVALSSTEAEYRAACYAACEGI